MTKILSIDLGKFKSVACLYQQKAQPVFRTFPTTPAALHDLLVELEPDRVVIEVCGIAGWIHDLCVSLDLPIAVVDTRHEAWRWNKVKHKTDRGDALKLARLRCHRPRLHPHSGQPASSIPRRSYAHCGHKEHPRLQLRHHTSTVGIAAPVTSIQCGIM